MGDADLEFEGHQGLQAPVEAQEVDLEIPPAHLERVSAADETEVPAQLEEDILEVQGRALR